MSPPPGLIERIFQFTAALLALAFLASGIFALCNGHVTVTAFDMWHLYEVALNQPFFHAAALKYGGHSIFFPSLIWETDLFVFRNNQQLLFAIGLTLLILSALILLIAIWKDKTIATTKLVATLVVVVANFTMGRASITSVGPFNCICSLVVVGAVAAFYILAAASGRKRFSGASISFLIGSGFVSSFSFGSGFAVWPTLLLLGWSARLSWRTLSIILVAGIVATIIYKILPGEVISIAPQDTISIGTAFSRFCSLLGTPFLYAAAAWSPHPFAFVRAHSPGLPFVCGAIGLALTGMAVVPRLLRRDLGPGKLQFMGLALTIFTFVAIGFIVIGRTAHMRISPGEVNAPRYMFWGFLFWAGLLLILLHKVDSKEVARWPVWLVLSTLPVLAFPQHHQGALWARTVKLSMESGTTGLINGVCDTEKIKVMYPNPVTVYRLAKQFRSQRLDMFADGLQSWIGAPATNLNGGQSHPVHLEGSLTIQALVSCDNGPPAARVAGWAMEQGSRIPGQLVLVDPAGIVCGIARPTEIRADVNRRYKLCELTTSGFLGYIRDYNPQTEYRARSVSNGAISEELLPVKAPTRTPKEG